MNNKIVESEKEIKGQILQQIDIQNEHIEDLEKNINELYKRLYNIMSTPTKDPAEEDIKEAKTLVPIADYIKTNRVCIQEINEKVKDMINSIEL